MKIIFYRNGKTYYYVYDNKEYIIDYSEINYSKMKEMSFLLNNSSVEIFKFLSDPDLISFAAGFFIAK